MSFEYHLENNLFSLYEDLISDKYKHSAYEYFTVFDNKKRDIHKAIICDRIIHQIIFDYLESIFETVFISDSYSSRKNKGSHQAVKTFRYFAQLAYDGNKKPCLVLKCDIKKYFGSIKPEILLEIIAKKVQDKKILQIISLVIYSFSDYGGGIPLGNITSQVFANIYLNELDVFIKQELKVRFYVRYNDDFVILDNSQNKLEQYLPKIRNFLEVELQLQIPAHKVSIRKLHWGVDFLGYTILPDAVLLRKKTKSKIFSNLNEENVISYLGMLSHCNSFNLKQKIISVLDKSDFLFE